MSVKFDKILAIDCETSGINFENRLDPADGYQMVSLALIVADTEKFQPIEELYLEIKWNGESEWNYKAETIHGLTRSYLEDNGVDEEDAANRVAEFIYEHFGDKALNLLGHNVVNFDMPFLRSLLTKFGYDFKFAHRHVDSFSLAMPTIGAYSSEEMFELMGYEKRGDHNSMEDIRMTLKTIATLSKLWKKAYEE